MSTPDAEAVLEKLAREVESCTRCDLYRDAHKGVPGDGSAHADVMFVGEGPGRNEDLQGHPFVGQAGNFLQELLSAAGLKREEVYITNVVKHRPTKKEPNGTIGNRAPTLDEMSACRVYLDRQLAAIDPGVVVTLGAHSLRAFFPDESIMRVHGTMRMQDGRHFFHSFHPAAALYKEQLRDTMLEDMRTLGAFLRERSEKDTGSKREPGDRERDGSDGDPEQLSLF
jgi:uracil-DNA glycosylase